MVTKSRNNIQIAFFAFLSVLAIVLLISNVKKAFYGCYNGYDLGIYFQAISNLSDFSSFNPFVPIRGVKIFNDHFDPIIFLPAVLIKILPNSEITLIIFEWLIGFSGLFIFYRLRNKEIELKKFFFFGCLYLLGRGILMALDFPIHGSTLSIPFWILLIYSLCKNRLSFFIFSSIGLALSKESYPILLLLWTPALFFFKRKREAISSFAIGTVGILFVFVLRPLLFGKTVDYGGKYINGILHHPFDFFSDAFVHQDWVGLIKIFIGLGVLVFFLFKNIDEKKQRENLFLTILLILPLFALQFLAQNFLFQYSFPFFVTLLSYAFFSNYIPTKKLESILLMLCFFIPSFRYYEQSISFLLKNKSKSCLISTDRIADIQQARKLIAELEVEKSVASTGGILQRLIPFHKNLYHLGSHGDSLESYHMIFLEKNKSGDIHPLLNEEVTETIKLLKELNLSLVYESENLAVFYDSAGIKRELLKFKSKSSEVFMDKVGLGEVR